MAKDGTNRGGARIGSGQKKKALADKILEGNPGNRKLTVIRYNVTGDERKRLVRAMGDILEAAPKYLGAPSFAYEVSFLTCNLM